MTIASKISDSVVDVHFEKAIGQYAVNGGYAAINNMFAKSLNGAEWLNREEDINIEGLRKAKQSYHPKILFYREGEAQSPFWTLELHDKIFLQDGTQ